jgi:DNA-binding CsgD family transcriptional regulator
MSLSPVEVERRHFYEAEQYLVNVEDFTVNLHINQEFIKRVRRRCFYLHDQSSFKKELMMAFSELYEHDASAILKACGAGFDQKGIQYGYPPQYLIDWTNQEPERCIHLKENYLEGPQRGYHTISSATIKNFDVDEKYKDRYKPFGFKYSLQTMFFDASGSPMCAYSYIRRSEPEVSEEERRLFDAVSPYIFYAFRKYKWLLDIDFFSSTSLDELLFGVITVDANHKITWMNYAAREIIDKQVDVIPASLPDELKHLSEHLKTMAERDEALFLGFRTIEHSTSFGSTLCFHFDNNGSKLLPINGEGSVFFIDSRYVDRGLISSLSKREREISLCFSKGMGDKEIAHLLAISEKTVQTYTQRIFKKLGVSNRTEAAMKALKFGLS